MTRYRASAIHLAISVLLGAGIFTCMSALWYPAPLLAAVGGTEIFLVLLAVDVTLGPLMTLIVFDVKKKSLRFDLMVIACVQVIALSYGLFTLLQGRPVFIAALGHRFDVVQANEVADEDIVASPNGLPLWGPRWVGTKAPMDSKKREEALFKALAGRDLGVTPQYHVPLPTMRDELLKSSKSIADLRARNGTNDREITIWLREHKRTDDDVVYQGLKARSQDMAVILDAKTAEVIGIAPFKPWD